MRFTPSEAAEFLNRVMGLVLSVDEINALEDRTEGWIAGLQLAAISMRGHEDIPGFIRAFAGDHRYIIDYLVAEVLQRQPEPVRRFLLQTAILDSLNGSLCDAVTGQEEGSARLEALERALTLAEPEGYVRMFVDEGPAMAQLLVEATARGILPYDTGKLLTAFKAEEQKRTGESSLPTSPASQPLVEPLTERELEILRLFKTELSGPEIAEKLVIALSTLRTHTKSIYSKLNVNSRRAAVQRATELDLM